MDWRNDLKPDIQCRIVQRWIRRVYIGCGNVCNDVRRAFSATRVFLHPLGLAAQAVILSALRASPSFRNEACLKSPTNHPFSSQITSVFASIYLVKLVECFFPVLNQKIRLPDLSPQNYENTRSVEFRSPVRAAFREPLAYEAGGCHWWPLNQRRR